MGQPIGAANPISQWTEDDLLAWMRQHMSYTPGGFTTDSMLTGPLEVRGPVKLSKTIQFKGMTAPVVVSAASGPGYQNACIDSSTSNVAKPQFYIDPFGWVHMRGTIRVPVAAINATMVIMPPGYRPDKVVTSSCACFDTTLGSWLSPSTRTIQIDTSGNLATVNISNSNPIDVHLDAVRFPLITNT